MSSRLRHPNPFREDDLLGRVMANAATSDRVFIADGMLTTVRVYDMPEPT